MKFKFIYFAFGILFQFETVFLREINSNKGQFNLGNNFTEFSKFQNILADDHTNGPNQGKKNPLSKGIILSETEEFNTDSTLQTVDQEKISSENKRKFTSNGKNQPENVTIEYPILNVNETWNVEKKEKNFDLSKEILETTKSSCQVTSEELVSTAQATVTRALKGLCNAKVMDDRFKDLENLINSQINGIKNMLLRLENRLSEHGDVVIHGQKQLSAIISKGCINAGNGNGNENTGVPPNNDLNNKTPKLSHDYSGSKITHSISGINGVNEDLEDDVSGPREPEILKFNSSIHMESSSNGPPKKVFTYYWKIKDMKYKLTGVHPRKTFRSQSFYIFPSGYRMYLRIFPRQNEENLYVRVGITKGEFDDSLNWPFPLKHKIHILDQTKEGRLFEDIASRVWDPNLLCSDFNWQKPIKGDNHECVEIGFPHDVLKQREYIRKDVLVIKLTVYLES